MNIKSIYLVLFISFFIFLTIGCISEHTPNGNIILNEEHQSQKFMVDNEVYEKLEWYFDGTLVKRDNTTGDISNFVLSWYDLSSGNHTLTFDNGIDTITWGVNVVKSDETQDGIENDEEQFSWNNTRSEWKDKSDRLINGEEI